MTACKIVSLLVVDLQIAVQGVKTQMLHVPSGKESNGSMGHLDKQGMLYAKLVGLHPIYNLCELNIFNLLGGMGWREETKQIMSLRKRECIRRDGHYVHLHVFVIVG